MRSSDLSGQVLDRRYQIVEKIAEGAMGVVYRGTRLKLDRAVAIKVMHVSLAEQTAAQKRFEREAKLMARLEHPHCVSIIDYGFQEGKPYVVMELVRGQSLFDMLLEAGRFEIGRAVGIMTQVLSGLAHAHEQGIIHRDIKPANIMATPKAPLGLHVRILDFGLARMLGTSASLSDGVAVGTPSYMAPEQCRGDDLDARVDIYACGIVLFEMLTGKKPFTATEPIDIIKKHLQDPAPRLADVTPGDYGALEGIVARALSKSRDDRYPSAVAMAEALEAAIAGRNSADSTAEFEVFRAPPSSSVDVPITVGSSVHSSNDGSSIRKMLPRSRMRSVALLCVLLAAGALGAVLLMNRDSAAVTPDAAPRAPDAAVIVASDSSDPDPIIVAAEQLVAQGKPDAAIDKLLDARKVYPERAAYPALAGKLYFAKMWWNDGVANLREAIKLDSALKRDPELVKIVVRAFTTTPAYDSRLAQLLVEIGEAAGPALEETARSHGNPGIRARATAMRKRLR